jgi:aarF domain-containing kinase
MGKWLRRFAGTAAIGGVGCVAFDLMNDYVLSRGVCALYTAARISADYKLTDPTTIEELSDLHARSADRLVRTLLRNEGLFIKFGQGLSSLNHLLPPEYTSRLQVLLDNAPTTPKDQILRIIREDLGRAAADVFETFDETPVAAASIAQVHRAVLKLPDGTRQEVAVKVLKPRIRNQVWWDLTVHDIVCCLMEYTFGLKVSWAAKTIRDNMTKEVDFRTELDYTEEGRRVWADREDLYIPRLFPDYCTSRVLVSEWIEATKLLDVATVKAKYDPKAAMQTLMESYGDGLFRYGFVHADPHPANVLIRMDPKRPNKQQVVLLDFGLCIRTSDDFRKQYARVWRAIFTQDMVELNEVVRAWGIADAELFASFQLQKPFSRSRPVHTSETTKEDIRRLQQHMKERLNKMLDDDSRVPRELVFVGRGAQLLRSLNKTYGAPVNRANIFASKAVQALGGHRRLSFAVVRFNFTLLLMSVAHLWTTYVNTLLAYLFVSYRVSTLEDVLEQQEKEFLQPKMQVGTRD